IRLWPGVAPGSEGQTGADVTKPSVNPKYAALPGDISTTHNPSIYVFLPPKEKANGVAMVVGPGGGQSHLVIEKEGWEIADWLNGMGIAAFILKYRLARAPGSKYTLSNEPFQDVTRALRLVRSRVKEWNLDPARIGFIGFSAGGEIGGMIGTKFDAGKPDAEDPIERVSSRADFNVLVYPFYRPGAMRPDQPALFPVTKDAPPTFLVCTDDDPSHVVPTVKFYLELQAQKVPAEMHIYGYGGHGFALRPTKKQSPVMTWSDRLKDWMMERGIWEPKS